MLKNELELQVSFEAIVKLRRIRERYKEAIPESEMRQHVIDVIDIQMRKIEGEIAEFLSKRKEESEKNEANRNKCSNERL